MATSIVNGGGTADQTTKNIHVLRVLERGLVLNRFYSRRRPEKRMFQIKLETRQLIWIRVAGGKPEGIGEYNCTVVTIFVVVFFEYSSERVNGLFVGWCRFVG